jgi:hypothetical protein
VVLRSDDNFLLVETQIEKETRIGWYGGGTRDPERASSFLAGFGLERTLSREVSAVRENLTLYSSALRPLTLHSRAPTLDLRGGLRGSRETVRFDANFCCLHSLNRGFALASLAPCDCF